MGISRAVIEKIVLFATIKAACTLGEIAKRTIGQTNCETEREDYFSGIFSVRCAPQFRSHCVRSRVQRINWFIYLNNIYGLIAFPPKYTSTLKCLYRGCLHRKNFFRNLRILLLWLLRLLDNIFSMWRLIWYENIWSNHHWSPL